MAFVLYAFLCKWVHREGVFGCVFRQQLVVMWNGSLYSWWVDSVDAADILCIILNQGYYQ